MLAGGVVAASAAPHEAVAGWNVPREFARGVSSLLGPVGFGADGTLATAWEQSDGIRFRIIRPDGSETTDRIDGRLYFDDAAVTVDADGAASLVWTDGHRIFVRTRPPAGDLGPPKTVARLPSGLVAQHVQAATALNNETTVLWAACKTEWRCAVMTATVRPDGTMDTTTQHALEDDVGAPILRVAPSGATAVLWSEISGDRFSIRARRRPAGSSFGAERGVTHAYSALSLRDEVGPLRTRIPMLRFPEMSADIGADGTVTLAWDRELPDRSNLVTAETIAATGVIGRARVAGHGEEPVVATAGSNSTVFFVNPPPEAPTAGGRLMVWTLSNGVPRGSAVSVSKATGVTSVNVAGSPTGVTVASWCCEGPRYRSVTVSAGGGLTRPVTLNRTERMEPVQTALAMSPEGRAFTAWSGFESNSNDTVFHESFGP